MASFTAAEARRLIIEGNAPAGMHVKGNLVLTETAITALPQGLSVDGCLNLRGSALAELPEKLSVEGNLRLNRTAITALPARLSVKGSLSLDETAVTSLPTDLFVGFDLGLSNTPITALPKGFTIVGFLDIRRTSITALPSDLSVGGHLYLDETAITALPEGLVLGWSLRPGTSSALTFPTAWFSQPHTETRWRALASDGVYTLTESDAGQIVAGCRGPWSRAEALAHWGAPWRTDDRARRFAAALRQIEPPVRPTPPPSRLRKEGAALDVLTRSWVFWDKGTRPPLTVLGRLLGRLGLYRP